MGIVAYCAYDAEVLRRSRILFYVVRANSPRFERPLGAMTIEAGRGTRACRGLGNDRCIGCRMFGLLPLIHKRMVDSRVTLPAAVVRVGGGLDRGQGLGVVRVFYVGLAGTMAVLALDIVIGRVLNDVPSSSSGCRITALIYCVAAEAEWLRSRAQFGQRLIRAGMPRGLPLSLHAHVAVAAGSLLVGGAEIAKKSGAGVGRRIYRVAEDDFL